MFWVVRLVAIAIESIIDFALWNFKALSLLNVCCAAPPHIPVIVLEWRGGHYFVQTTRVAWATIFRIAILDVLRENGTNVPCVN